MAGRFVSLCVCLCLVGSSAAAAPAPDDLLVLLEDTGEVRDELPVLRIHPGDEQLEAVLRRGVSGTLLRVYRLSQHYLQRQTGIQPEPAYLLLSDHRGGFAREGFFLGDQEKRHAAYVDLYHGGPAAGRFGAGDQIFPHELAHAIRLQLAGPIVEGYANQVHALGLRTDRATAFNEGFAEHFQVMAIDHPDADPATRALADETERFAAVDRHLAAYQRELMARVSLAPRMRMGFLAWYSNDEDVQRYAAVKSNAFAHEAVLPARLLGRDPYRAYLLEGVLPGAPEAPLKPPARLVATEAVVSTFFHRWATSATMRDSYGDEAFYGEFGVSAAEVTPLENVYLKLAHAMYVAKPQDVLDLVEGYRRLFPDEAEAVGRLFRDVFGSSAEAPTEIPLANPHFHTGTTLFDQFRGLPRAHTFDLNAASLVDLVAVPGIDAKLARKMIDHAPFDSLQDLRTVEGVTPELIETFETLAAEMARMEAEADDESVEDVISIGAILRPYLWRLIAALLVSTACAAWLHHRARTAGSLATPAFRWWRSGLNGFAASLFGLVGGWATASAGLGSFVAVGVLFAIPAAAICLWKTRRGPAVFRVAAAWLLASLPAAVATTPLL